MKRIDKINSNYFIVTNTRYGVAKGTIVENLHEKQKIRDNKPALAVKNMETDTTHIILKKYLEPIIL